MNTKYWFVRHGEAEHNIKNVLNDDFRMKSHLTVKGISQASVAKSILKDVDFDAIFSSQFDRCIETATIIIEDRDFSLNLYLDTRLHERKSNMDGEPARKFYEVYGNLLNPKCEGTENFYNILSRTSDFIQETRGMYNNILVVTHGDVMRAARCIFHMTAPIDELRLKTPYNCQVMEFDLPDNLPKRS